MAKRQEEIFVVIDIEKEFRGYFGSEQLALDYVVEHDLNEASILTVIRVCIAYAPDDPDWNLDEENLKDMLKK